MIIIKKEILDKINAHGEQDFPNECCGFLFGEEKDTRIIDQVLPAQNYKEGDQRRRFEISPREYLEAERYALENQTQLLGIYHSHPNHPAIASDHDLRQALPYFSYVIISVHEAKAVDIKSWKLLEETRIFEEEQVEINSF